MAFASARGSVGELGIAHSSLGRESQLRARQRFPNLFSPFRLCGVEIRNRIVSTAHGTASSERSLPTPATAAYHEARASGGVGLIILEAASVHTTAVYNDIFLSCHTDAAIPGFARIAKQVHAHGATVFGQLYHPGASMRGHLGGVRQAPIGPSCVPAETNTIAPRTMSLALIHEVVRAFGEAAARMMKAGTDGIEINARNGNLVAQFINPRSNQRTDAYGGDLANRLRFLVSVIEEVRGRIGRDAPLGLRISAEPMDELGPSAQEAAEAAKMLAALVDYFDVIGGSLGTFAGISHIAPPMGVPTDYLVVRAAEIRARTGRPVLVAGRITRPEHAERLIAEGRADLCGMTRALIADPELPNKALAGRTDDIRECIGCNQACIGHEVLGAQVSCIQRPETGRELMFTGRSRVATPKRVMIAGGGPAGLKAAAVAAERGHRVKLFERSSAFGGQARLAALIPGRSEFGGITTNLMHEAYKHGAELISNVTVHSDFIHRERPDSLIIATGSAPYRWEFDGAEEIKTVDASEVLAGKAEVGGATVIADERCDWVAMGVAEKLVRDGCWVRLFVIGDTAGQAIDYMTRYRWLGVLHSLGVEITTHLRIAGASADTIYFQHVASLKPVMVDRVDTLVLAQRHRPASELEVSLGNYDGHIQIIGDCVAPRSAEEAVYEGLLAGLAV